jgi:hypothetical protein
LPNDANAVATCPIDRDDRLKSELELVGHVDHAGIDGSSRAFFIIQVGDLRLKVALLRVKQTSETAFAEAYGGSITVTAEQVDLLGLPTAPPKATDNGAFTGETCQAEATPPDTLSTPYKTGLTMTPAKKS